MIRIVQSIIDGEVVLDGLKVAEINWDMTQFLVESFSESIVVTPETAPTPTRGEVLKSQGQIDSEKIWLKKLGTTDRITCETLQQFTYAVQTRDNLPQVRNVTCNVREGGTNIVYFWSREDDTVRVADCSKYWTHSMCHPSSDDVRHYSSDEWVELTRK